MATRSPVALAAVALALSLAACNGEGTASSAAPPVSTPAGTTGQITGLGFDVSPCLNQTVVPGITTAGLVVPDVIKINLAAPAGFPNGRQLADPVIDVTLAALFLDLSVHSPTTLAAVPVNPPANDLPFSATFPFLAAPQGTPPISAVGGTGFNFRTDPDSAFVSVDRTGMPAVATALVSGAQKNAFNDDSPAIDATGKWVPEFTTSLAALTLALADDFDRLGLTKCARGF